MTLKNIILDNLRWLLFAKLGSQLITWISTLFVMRIPVSYTHLDVYKRQDLTSAGEDYLFWLELSHRGARFAFGAAPSVFYGKGVNVYAGAGWGTDGHARRIVHELTYRKALLSLYQLNAQQRILVEEAIRHLDEAFVADCLHRAAHRKPIDWNLVFRILQLEPRITLKAVQVFARKILPFARH